MRLGRGAVVGGAVAEPLPPALAALLPLAVGAALARAVDRVVAARVVARPLGIWKTQKGIANAKACNNDTPKVAINDRWH